MRSAPRFVALAAPVCLVAVGVLADGEVAEWPIVPDSKSGVPVRVPWVRIPPSPPVFVYWNASAYAFPREVLEKAELGYKNLKKPENQRFTKEVPGEMRFWKKTTPAPRNRA